VGDPESAPGRVNGPGEVKTPAPSKADDTASIARALVAPQWLTEDLTELAADLRCSPRHVEAMDRDGRLGPRAIRLGRRRVWIRTEIQAWLAAGAPDRVTWLATHARTR